MNINFNVYGQKLICRNNTETNLPVEGTKNFLTCKFDFTPEWDNLHRAVLFLAEGETAPIPVILDSENKCKIPNIIANNVGICYISVIGGNSADFIDEIKNSVVSENIIITTSIYTMHFDKTIRISETSTDKDFSNPLVDLLSMLENKQEKEFIVTCTISETPYELIISDVSATYDDLQKAYTNGNNIKLQIYFKHLFINDLTMHCNLNEIYPDGYGFRWVHSGTEYIVKCIKDEGWSAVEYVTFPSVNDFANCSNQISIVRRTANENTAHIDTLNEQLGDIDTALDSIIAIQNTLIGGESE